MTHIIIVWGSEGNVQEPVFSSAFMWVPGPELPHGPLHLCSSLDLDVILPSSRLSFSHVAIFLGCDSFFSFFKLPLSEIPFPVPYPTESSCVFLYRTLMKTMVLLAPSCIVTVGGQGLSCLIIVSIAH